MKALLIAFLLGTAGVWLSVFGYVLALRWFATRARRGGTVSEEWPDVAVVVPVLNEEALIAAKLADLRRTDYPPERLTLVVVDGGSTDGTVERVQREIDAGRAVRLLRVEGARGKSAQINYALARVQQEIVVATDADAVLEPACVRELVAALVRDPATAIVGATVRPASGLLEERVYWWLLNHLWWLEGEALSASIVSGVCYAMRRSQSLPIPAGKVDDVHLALAAGARGLRVRLCRTAQATEVRVPQTPSEVLQFRRRRGAGYVNELQRLRPPADAPLRWRLLRQVRLWHFFVTPRATVALVLLGVVVLLSEHWAWAVVVFVAFAAPALAAFARGVCEESDATGWWRIGFAATRLVGLTWLALLTLTRYTPATKTGE